MTDTIDRILDAGLTDAKREGTMTTQLIQTANGYVLCSSHAEAWHRGGNDVSMWPANEQEAEQGGSECCDCLADRMQKAIEEAQQGTECAECGLPIYRAMNESIGATGSLHSKVVFRHEATGYIACPQRRSFPTMTVGGLYGAEYSGRTIEEAAVAAKDAGETVLDMMDDTIVVE